MPLDPSISLDVNGGGSGLMQPGGGGASGNPFSMLQSMAATRTALIQAKQAQAEFAAKQVAGQIMASAPDPQTGIAMLQKDPRTAAFAPEIAASAAGTYSALTGAQGAIQAQGHDAFSNLVKQFPAVIQDPSQWDTLVNTSLQLASPAIKGELKKSFDNLNSGLNLPNPDGSPVTPEQKTQRLSGWAIANGAGDAIPRIAGAAGNYNLGNKIVTGITAPPQGGLHGEAPGSFTPTGNALTPGIAPTLTSPEAVPFGGGGSQTKNPLSVAGSGQGPSTPARNPSGQPTTTPPSQPSSFLGTPLFTADTPMKPTGEPSPRNLGGNPTNSTAKALLDTYNTDGKKNYDAAIGLRSSLADVSSDLTTLGKGGGLMVPGTAGETRAEVGKFLSTMEAITGKTSDLDVKSAAAQDLMKTTQRMGINWLTSQLGDQREAAETIRNVTDRAMPGINNTVLGGKMITGMISAMNERTIERRKWEDEWAARNGQDLRGADQAFDTQFPPEKYINKVLSGYGISKDGMSPQAAQQALQQGMITHEQYDLMKANKGKLPEQEE